MKKSLFTMTALIAVAMTAQAQSIEPRTPVVPWAAQAEIIISNDLTQQNTDGSWTLTEDAKTWVEYSYDGTTENGTIQQTNRANLWFDIYDETTDTIITTGAEKNWGGYITVTSKTGSTSGLMVVGKERFPSFYVTGTDKAKFYFSGSSGTAGYPQIEVYEVGNETAIATYTGDIALTKKTWDKSTLLIADGLDRTKSYKFVARTMALVDGAFTYDGGDIVLQAIKFYGEQAPLGTTKILSGSEIGSYVEAYRTANPGANEFTLEGNGRYTIKQSINSDNGFSLKGEANAPATIDASALEKPFIKLSNDTVFALNADGTTSTSYYYMKDVTIANVTIKGLQKAVVQEDQKILLENLTIDNAVINHAGGNANIFNFNGQGYPAKLTVKNSTIYADSASVHKGYFLQAGGRVRDLDPDQTSFKEIMEIENSTISNIAVGQQINNLRGNGQKSLSFTLKNSILNNFGTKVSAMIRGWLGGNASPNPTVVYENNTYMTGDSICTEWTGTTAGADTTKTQLTTLPFTKVDNNFTVKSSSMQAKLMTGDPRWLVPYATDKILIEVDQSENTDFAAVLNEKLQESEAPSSITITFYEAGEYPTTAEINTTSPITIQCQDIDAGEASIVVNQGMTLGNEIKIDGVNLIAGETLTTPMITLQGNPWKLQSNNFYNFGNIKLLNLKVSGLKSDLIYGNKVKNQIKEIETKNCEIYMEAGSKTAYNFNGGGAVGTWNFVNSTFDAQGNIFFSSQSGNKATEAGFTQQIFNIQNSTVINPGKKAFQHRQNGQKWLRYILKNSLVVVNSEKTNFAAEMNAGGLSSNPIWEITGNAFQIPNADTGLLDDASEKQNTGDTDEPVANNVAGTMVFDADGFGGTFTLAAGIEQPTALGDPRWTINYVTPTPTGIETVNEEKAADGVIFNLAGQRIANPMKGQIFIQNGKKHIAK